MLLNVGSGQRRFDTAQGWVNLDCVSRAGEVPDVIADARSLPYEDGSVEMVVLHQTLEHFLLHEGAKVLREANRVLAPGGSLIITLPDIRALAQHWLMGKLDDYIYVVNLMGAWHGADGDSHRWHYTQDSLEKTLVDTGKWFAIGRFDWRPIAGADIARDWWILGMEAVK